jgi:hypothetical protein
MGFVVERGKKKRICLPLVNSFVNISETRSKAFCVRQLNSTRNAKSINFNVTHVNVKHVKSLWLLARSLREKIPSNMRR